MVRLLDCEVHPQTCVIENVETSQTVKVSPRAMDVLKYLLDTQGRVVSSAELLDQLWRNSASSDHAVHNAIAELRAALGDRANNPRYIKTYPKRGYALIPSPGEVHNPDEREASAVWNSVSAYFTRYRQLLILACLPVITVMAIAWYGYKPQTPEPDVLLVRPLDTINVDASNQYWAEQLPASLVTHLSGLPNVFVIRLRLSIRLICSLS